MALFPDFGSKNIRLYYILTIFLHGMFILPNWVFYFGRFISIPAIGLIDGLSKFVSIVLEVPTGAVSDLFGKKRTLIMGNLSFAICCLILINSTTFTSLLIGNIVMFVGFALISGSKEAILYDYLIDIKKQDRYEEVLGRVNTITIITTIVTIFAGGLLYGFSPELTFWAWFTFNMFAIVTLLFMTEPVADEEELTYTQYIKKLKSGTKSIFQNSFIRFILPVLFFAMLIRSYEGVVRQNTGAYFGFNGETFGYLFALISIPAVVISYNFGKIYKKFGRSTEYIFVALYSIGFLIIFLTNKLYFGLFSFISVYAAQEIAKPYITSLVNKNTDSKHRATALSTVSLFADIPYMLIVIFMGFLIEVDTIRFLYLGLVTALFLYVTIRYLLVNNGRKSNRHTDKSN